MGGGYGKDGAVAPRKTVKHVFRFPTTSTATSRLCNRLHLRGQHCGLLCCRLCVELLADFTGFGVEPHQEFVGQCDADYFAGLACGLQALVEGDEVRLVTAGDSGHDEQDLTHRSASATHAALALQFAAV